MLDTIRITCTCAVDNFIHVIIYTIVVAAYLPMFKLQQPSEKLPATAKLDCKSVADATSAAESQPTSTAVNLESGFHFVGKAIDSYVSLNSQLQKFIKVLRPEHQASLASLTEQYVRLCQQFYNFLALTKSGMVTLTRFINRFAIFLQLYSVYRRVFPSYYMD